MTISEIEEIQKIIDINQLKSDFDLPVISSVEWCHKPRKPPDKPTRDKWLQDYTVPGGYFKNEQSLKNTYWEKGDVIAAIDAVKINEQNISLDVRPKVFDKITKSWVLLDSGSCVSCRVVQNYTKYKKAIIYK